MYKNNFLKFLVHRRFPSMNQEIKFLAAMFLFSFHNILLFLILKKFVFRCLRYINLLFFFDKFSANCRLVVILLEKTYIYDINSLEILDTLDTVQNLKGQHLMSFFYCNFLGCYHYILDAEPLFSVSLITFLLCFTGFAHNLIFCVFPFEYCMPSLNSSLINSNS